MVTTEAIPESISEHSTATKPPRKRRRLVISCVECHRRKQKCDRGMPCSNCCSRNKQDACRYETLPPNAKTRRKTNASDVSQGTADTTVAESVAASEHDEPPAADSSVQLADLGYANSTNLNSLGVFKKIENYGTEGTMSTASAAPTIRSGLAEKYKAIVKQLPSKQVQNQLVKTYFQDVNPFYLPLDEYVFNDMHNEWNNLSFSQLNQGPQAIPLDLRFFPAVLFQVLALGLLFQQVEDAPFIESVKYAADMSYDDVASEWSDASVSILNLLGKREMSLLAVQAGFLRASFNKMIGLITESWHSLGQTIRDAQEIGLDKDLQLPTSSNDPGKAIESLWMLELRRRMWIILHNWDEHISLVLGRAKSGVFDASLVKLPLDTKFPKDRTKTLPMPRTELDPPTHMTKILANYMLLSMIPKIIALEKEGPHPRNSLKIDALHEEIVRNNEKIPAYLRLENPDTSWDNHPDCGWLPGARPYMETNCAFLILSLHKPYIFTMQKSRRAALHAALQVLEYQKLILDKFLPRHFKMHNPVMSTFDAIVVVAAIYIIHPEENRDRLDEAMAYFEWCCEAMNKMATRNTLAKSALSVLRAVRARLMKALGPQRMGSMSSDVSPMSNMTSNVSPPSSSSSIGAPTPQEQKTIPEPAIGLTQSLATPEFNFENMQTLQPTHDLLWNDLSSTYNTGTFDDTPYLDPSLAWQFAGDFHGDSFWDFLNQSAPA